MGGHGRLSCGLGVDSITLGAVAGRPTPASRLWGAGRLLAASAAPGAFGWWVRSFFRPPSPLWPSWGPVEPEPGEARPTSPGSGADGEPDEGAGPALGGAEGGRVRAGDGAAELISNDQIPAGCVS